MRPGSDNPPAPMRIDCHVHVVGNGTGGTGCWYRPRGVTRLGAPLMLRGMGLPRTALTGDLDGVFAEQILNWVCGRRVTDF